MIGFKNAVFDQTARRSCDRMGDVPENTVIIPAAGHRNKKPLRAFDHFDVVNCQFTINRQRNKCPQSGILIGTVGF